MIKYRYHPNYKYTMEGRASCQTPFHPNEDISTEYIHLTCEGVLTVEHRYSWDGPSGPAIDTKNFMRGSLFHDALYQLMRMQRIPRDEAAREKADALLRQHCLEDGMSRIRAWWVYHGVRVGGAPSTLPRKDHKYHQILVAP